jgi:predicted nucleic acid-binding protein
VVTEFLHPKTPNVVSKWIQQPPSWLRISTPKNIFPPAVVLDPGEAAAISLAKELGAEAVLIDERKGRLFASQNGLVSFGTLTILELASEIKLVDLRNSLHALQRTSFYLTDALINDILKRSSEK